MKSSFLKIIGLATIASAIALPATSSADRHDYGNHRQSMQNQWKNIGIGSAALGVLGLITHNDTLGILGAAGAGYSAYRYEQDQNGQRSWDNRYDSRNRNSYDQRDRDDRSYRNDRNNGNDRKDRNDRNDRSLRGR